MYQTFTNLTIPAGETWRFPWFNLTSATVAYNIRADGPLEWWIEHGRQSVVSGPKDVPAPTPNGPTEVEASLPFGTEVAETGANDEAGGGQAVIITVYGGSDVGQLVVRNPGGTAVTVSRIYGGDA